MEALHVQDFRLWFAAFSTVAARMGLEGPRTQAVRAPCPQASPAACLEPTLVRQAPASWDQGRPLGRAPVDGLCSQQWEDEFLLLLLCFSVRTVSQDLKSGK